VPERLVAADDGAEAGQDRVDGRVEDEITGTGGRPTA